MEALTMIILVILVVTLTIILIRALRRVMYKEPPTFIDTLSAEIEGKANDIIEEWNIHFCPDPSLRTKKMETRMKALRRRMFEELR